MTTGHSTNQEGCLLSLLGMLILQHLSYEFRCKFERHGDLKFLHEHSSILGSDVSSGRMNVLFGTGVSLKTQASQVLQCLDVSTLPSLF